MLSEFSGWAERAVNFVRRDLDEALDAVAAGAIQQYTGANHICMNEIQRIVNASIHVRFGCEIDYCIELMLRHQCVHLIGVCDIGFEKLVAFAMFFDHAVQIGDVAGISKHIDVGHVRGLVMLQNISNKVAPDESTATGYKDAHGSAY